MSNPPRTVAQASASKRCNPAAASVGVVSTLVAELPSSGAFGSPFFRRGAGRAVAAELHGPA